MDLNSSLASLRFEPVGALLQSLDLNAPPHALLRSEAALFDLALPLPEDLPHRLTIGAVQQPSDAQALRYETMQSDRGVFPIACSLQLSLDDSGGFALQLTVSNHSPYVIPQVLFPRLIGLGPAGHASEEMLHFGRSVKWPYASMHSSHGAANFLDLHRRWYFTYGMQDWNSKWFRLGDAARGLAVFSRDLNVPLQGLYVEKHAGVDRLTISWAHYPHIQPGETWISPQIVLFPHYGDWRVGAEPYKRHVTTLLPTVKPTRYLSGSLGVRSLFFSTYLYDDVPNVIFRELPKVARDAMDHGIHELNLWFLFEAYFEFPMRLNPRLGTAEELKAALMECRQMGVNIAAFVSCRSLKAATAPPGWFEVDERGNRRTQHYSYSLGFVPPFNPPYCNRDESAFICPAVAEYRQAFLTGVRELHSLGFSSVSYDQLFADRLCYGIGHGHRPQELLTPLYDTVREAHQLGKAVDPEASLSGEFFNDVSQTFQHYNWDWISGNSSLDELEAFRFIFPKFRMGLLVDRSKRWLLEGFCRGMLINFLPDGAEGFIGIDKSFSALTKRLADARKTYSRFFEAGEYLGTENVAHAPGVISSLYRHDDQYLLILANLTDKPTQVAPSSRRPVPVSPAAHLAPMAFIFYTWRAGAENWDSV